MSKAIRNEQAKYLAASLDRASTACFAIGGIAPLTSILAGAVMPSNPTLFFVGMALRGVAGVALNRMGHLALERIEE